MTSTWEKSGVDVSYLALSYSGWKCRSSKMLQGQNLAVMLQGQNVAVMLQGQNVAIVKHTKTKSQSI